MASRMIKTTLTSAETIGSVYDLLIQILVRLPVKSLMRFKCVSKYWESVITSSRFSHLCSSTRAVGFFYRAREIPELQYINLDVKRPSMPHIEKLPRFPEEPSCAFWLHQSCNGLLLCCSNAYSNQTPYRIDSPIRICYVVNPTTNCFAKLPRPGVLYNVPRPVHAVNLAFDHAKSSLYKAVCVRGSEFGCKLFQIEVYSSETGVWRVCGEPFAAPGADFNNGVYWNGSVHWTSIFRKELLYFDVNDERLVRAHLPLEMTKVSYFGESCDHLHIIGNIDIVLDVYEMKRDYSEWFVKYRVNLAIVLNSYPNVTYSMWHLHHAISVFSIIRRDEEEDEGSLLVLQVSRKVVVLYDLKCNTLEEIHDFGHEVGRGSSLPHVFEYIESLASV